MATRAQSPRNPADRYRRSEPVGRDKYEAANYATCTLFDQIVERLPGGLKALGDAGADRASRIRAYATYVSFGDLLRLADAGRREEVDALLQAMREQIKQAPQPDGEIALAEYARESGEMMALGIEAARDPSLRRRKLDETLDVIRVATTLAVNDMRQIFDDAQLNTIARARMGLPTDGPRAA